MISRLIFLAMLVSVSCELKQEPDINSYIKSQVDQRLLTHINHEAKACDELALSRAHFYVDSLYQVNPIKFLSDSLDLPSKPRRPEFPEFE